MKKLKNNGFTLVELLAVIVILGMVMTIVIPNVGMLINKNKEENEKQLIKSIETATKLYISDYKYEISLTSATCSADNTIEIDKIGTNDLSPNSQIKISTLIDEGNLTVSKDGNIYNPKNKEEKLNLDNSYIIVKYNCKTKDYTYNEPLLEWQ